MKKNSAFFGAFFISFATYQIFIDNMETVAIVYIFFAIALYKNMRESIALLRSDLRTILRGTLVALARLAGLTIRIIKNIKK